MSYTYIPITLAYYIVINYSNGIYVYTIILYNG